MTTGPPRRLEGMLRRVLPEHTIGSSLLGDLHEEYVSLRVARGRLRADFWYSRQVLGLGGPWLLRGAVRAIGHLLREVSHDLRLASRVLLHRPVFTATAALTLAVAMAGNAAVFSLVHATLVRPLPFPEADGLMRIFIRAPDGRQGNEMRQVTWSYPKYRLLRDRQGVFERLSVFRAARFTLAGEPEAEELEGEIVGEAYLDLLGIEPMLGRNFTTEEDAVPGRDYVALISHNLWNRLYGRAPGVLGRQIRLSGRSHRVIGVLPPGFHGLTGGAEVWVPVMTLPATDLERHTAHNKHVLGRLKKDVSPEAARAALDELGREIHRVYPGVGSGADRWTAGAVLLAEERVNPAIRKSVGFVFVAVAALLLIACLNLASLFAAKAMGRRREVAVRRALGASRGRIARQLLTESTVLAFVGGTGGLLLGYWGVGLIRRIAPTVVGHEGIFRGSMAGLTDLGLSSIRFNGSVVLFVVATAALSGLLFGAPAALHGSRRAHGDPLRDRFGSPPKRLLGWLSARGGLVVTQMALTFALLTGAGLMIQSWDRLLAQDMGFDPEGVLSARVSLPPSRYDSASTEAFFSHLQRRLQAIPGVEWVGMNQCVPLTPCFGTRIAILGNGDPRDDVVVGIHRVDPNYFRALDMQVVRGRSLTTEDNEERVKVAVISESAATRFWPGRDPIGNGIRLGSDTLQVVGVVGDVRYADLEQDPQPQVYLSLAQAPWQAGYLVLRSRGDLTPLVPPLRRFVRELDPDVPVTDLRTLSDRVGDAASRYRFGAGLGTLFALVALALATIGTYGVVAFDVRQQVHEIGVRKALGARDPDVLRLIVGRAVSMAVTGIIAGLAVIYASGPALQKVLFGIAPLDAPTVLATALLLTSVATLASWLPAHKALLVDPVQALQRE